MLLLLEALPLTSPVHLWLYTLTLHCLHSIRASAFTVMPGDWQGCQGKQGHGDNTVNKGSSWRLSLLSACVEDGKPSPLPRSSARTLAPAEQPQRWAPADSAWFMHWEAGGRCARSGISASLQDTVNLHPCSLYDGSCLLARARQRGFPSLQAAVFSGPLHLTVIYMWTLLGIFSCLYLIPSYYPSVGLMDDYCNSALEKHSADEMLVSSSLHQHPSPVWGTFTDTSNHLCPLVLYRRQSSQLKPSTSSLDQKNHHQNPPKKTQTNCAWGIIFLKVEFAFAFFFFLLSLWTLSPFTPCLLVSSSSGRAWTKQHEVCQHRPSIDGCFCIFGAASVLTSLGSSRFLIEPEGTNSFGLLGYH